MFRLWKSFCTPWHRLIQLPSSPKPINDLLRRRALQRIRAGSIGCGAAPPPPVEVEVVVAGAEATGSPA